MKVGTVAAPARSASARFDRLTQALEWPMAILALAVIPALLLDDIEGKLARLPTHRPEGV